jgi:hypothetical protein
MGLPLLLLLWWPPWWPPWWSVGRPLPLLMLERRFRFHQRRCER